MLRMTQWSSRSTTFSRSFVHHVRGPTDVLRDPRGDDPPVRQAARVVEGWYFLEVMRREETRQS